MNQRGEVISLSVLIILVMSSFLILCSLELRKDYKELKERAQLFICTKEFKGELEIFLTQIGKTNWAIKNLDRLSKTSLLIPGLQGASVKSANAKKLLILYQNTLLISYLKKLTSLKGRSCPIRSDFFKTPFHITLSGFKRDQLGGALLRSSELKYSLTVGGNTLLLKSSLSMIENISPKVSINSWEIRGKRFFHSSFL